MSGRKSTARTGLKTGHLSDEAASFELMYSFIAFGRALDRTHDVVIQRFASWLILERHLIAHG
jgi:hypothetical protein